MSFFKNCTKNCETAPHVCNCDFMPGKQVFLTEQDRQNYEKKWHKTQTGWRYPYEPWVIESWKIAAQENGWDKAAQRFRDKMYDTLKKVQKLQMSSLYGKKLTK